MDLFIKINDPNRVSKQSISELIKMLEDDGYIDNDSIGYVSNEYYNPSINDYVGNSWDPKTTSKAIEVINDINDINDIKALGINFEYKNHYKYDGRPTDTSHLQKIMYCLNIASHEVAEMIGEEISIDFYLPVLFQNGISTEWGVIEKCGLKLSGEGGYIDEDKRDAAINKIFMVMKKECPEFNKLIERMSVIFGGISPSLED